MVTPERGTVARMRYSVWPTNDRPWAEVLEVARWADEAGWHGLWYADHYMPNTDDGSVAGGPALECWSVLGAVAATTTNLRIGPLVSPTSVHHPVVLANRACTMDDVSGGRFTLGMGAGWQVNEHRAYGIELQDPGPRVSRFAEAIEIVHRMLREDRVTFHGEWYRLTDAPCEPKPVQDPLPIVVGTGSQRMLRLTARWAQQWNTWGDAARVRRLSEAFLTACDAERRDPASMWRSAQALVLFADDRATADRLRERALPERSLIGTPAQIADEISQIAALGTDEFIVPGRGAGPTPEARRETYERFWTEVVPNVG